MSLTTDCHVQEHDPQADKGHHIVHGPHKLGQVLHFSEKSVLKSLNVNEKQNETFVNPSQADNVESS